MAPPPHRPGDLTEGPIARTLAVFALPVLGSSVLQSLSASINAVWVGRFLGEAALAATSNANLVLFLLLGMIFGVGMAATILVGQAFGRGDEDLARRVVGSSVAFFLIISVVFTTGGWLGADAILTLVGTPHDALPLARAYLRVIFLALPLMNFATLAMMLLRGAGDSRTPFLFMGLSAGLDLAINPVLILGLGPFPEMGIAGAAMATLVSQAISLAALLVFLYARKHPLRLVGANLAYLKPDPALLRTLTIKGLPMGLQMIVISASALIVMSLVNSFGSRTAAAYGVAAQLWTYVQMPAMSIGAAVSSMAAQNVGAGRWDRVARITRVGIGFNILLTGIMVAVLYAVAGPAMSLFLPSDPAAVAIAIHINQLVVWTFIPFGVTIVLFATVRATGDVWPPLVILSLSIILVRIPFAYLLEPAWGQDAIWWSFAFGSAVALMLSVLYYRLGRWKQARMLDDRPAAGEAPDTGHGLPRERAVLAPAALNREAARPGSPAGPSARLPPNPESGSPPSAAPAGSSAASRSPPARDR
ncbi:MAG TPA: MATE family efflux transporter [Caulobacter sp.]|nr:MATE family efflux transporter [Caulobacter sp.]